MEQLWVIGVDTLPLRGLSPYLWAVYNFFQRLSYGKGEWLLTDTPSVTQQVTIHRTDSRGRLDPGCIQPHSLCLCAFPSQADTLSNQKKTMRDILQNSWPAPLRVLCKHQDLSSGPRASVESQAWVHMSVTPALVVELVAPSKVPGSVSNPVLKE